MGLVPDLKGRVALVTGASRGIGRAIALALAEAGADVAINCRQRVADARNVADAVEGLGRKSVVVPADVSSGAEVSTMIESVGKALGPVDILVNNAGVMLRRTVDDLTEDDFDTTIAVNLKSVFLCTQAVLPHMRSQTWGRIVNISSGAARGIGSVGLHYNASKAGMEGMTRGYAVRLAQQGITVNAVAPSLVATEELPIPRAEAKSRIPLGRLGRVDEVAQVVVMVVGNDYVTGQTIQVNGGTYLI